MGETGSMLELKLFRSMLVLVGAVLVCTGVAWLLLQEGERAAAATVQSSFDQYNRYVEACDGRTDGETWDLATRASGVLRQASAERALQAERQRLWLRAGGLVGVALVAGFYAVRWALTGRLRPIWLTTTGPGSPSATIADGAPNAASG